MKKKLFIFSLFISPLFFSSSTLAWDEGECRDSWYPREQELGTDVALENYYKCEEELLAGRTVTEVPEIDSTGGIGAIGLMAAILGLMREKKRRS